VGTAFTDSTNGMTPLYMKAELTTPDTTTINFKIRYGRGIGTNNVSINRSDSASSYLGLKQQSSLTVTPRNP